jgi:hypothetical protein
MADDKKTKPKEKAPAEKPAVETKDKAAESTTDAPAEAKAEKSYSRGEGQKAVTQAYKDNWNAIFGSKKNSKNKKP